MKQILLFLGLLPCFLFSQIQIGNDINGESVDDSSGERKSLSLSSDGNIVAIGAPNNDGNGNNSGHVRVYLNMNGTWSQIGQDIDGESTEDYSGSSISISSDGSIVAIGAPKNDGNGNNSGHVRVYENVANVWTQVGQDIDGEAAGDGSGTSVSLSSDGTIVAIGASSNSGNGGLSGHVRVYKNMSGVWTQIGQDIDGKAGFDQLGTSISLSSNGNILASGAPYNNDNGFYSGHVRVYENMSGTWTQIGQDINGESEGDHSGRSVSLSSDGNIIAIGAPYNSDNGFDAGHVRVYQNLSGVWTQIGQDIDGEDGNDVTGFGDESGGSVSLSSDGSIVAIGAISNDGNGENSGHVRVYKNISGTWTQVGSDIDGKASEDESGDSVFLSSDGSIVAIGAPSNNSGYVSIYDLSSILSSNEFVLARFELYPNPASTQFKIQLQSGLKLQKVTIYNQIGQFIKEET